MGIINLIMLAHGSNPYSIRNSYRVTTLIYYQHGLAVVLS